MFCARIDVRATVRTPTPDSTTASGYHVLSKHAQEEPAKQANVDAPSVRQIGGVLREGRILKEKHDSVLRKKTSNFPV